MSLKISELPTQTAISGNDYLVGDNGTDTTYKFQVSVLEAEVNAAIEQTASDAVASVNTAKTQAVSAVGTKGDEVLDSIPQDYTELVSEVDNMILIQDTEPTGTAKAKNKIWIKGTGTNVQVPDMDDFSELKNDLSTVYPLHQYINENQWDELWELGTISQSTGLPIDSTTAIRSINFIDIEPGHRYYLHSPTSVVLYLYDANKDFIRNVTWAANTTRTFGTNEYYAKIRPASAYGTVYNYDISINYHSDETAYYPASFDRRHTDDIATENSRELITSGAVYKLLSRMKYVASSGNDSTGDGSKGAPYATINKALEERATVILLAGGTYREQIDLSKLHGNSLVIASYQKTNRSVIKDNEGLIATSESLVSGYTKVYSSQVADYVDDINNNWIYQDAGFDDTTLISNDERMPQQRGLTYRCEDVKIVRCNATTKTDALAEIENATEFKWYYDEAENTIYFSRKRAVTASYPIMRSVGNTLFINVPERDIHVELYGLYVKYYRANMDNMRSPRLTDCTIYNVYGAGCVTWDGAIDAEFKNCDVCHAQSGLVGDGFNAHSVNEGSALAKQTTGRLYDCWSHDNNDDGYSDHERCEMSIYGGLFEYNGKAGIAPSYGSHCVCYNVISRHNINGFFCTGEAVTAEGGNYTQMQCNNCVAIDNNSNDQSGGFRVGGANNKMILFGCKSIRNTNAYYSQSNTIADIVDCSDIGSTRQTNGGGTFNITNTQMISG